MALIRDSDRRKLGQMFQSLAGPVKLVFFTQEFECDSCRETGELLKETAALSDRISVESYNFQLDREQVTQYGVDKIPALAVSGARDYGIRFYGIPAGYEFANLVDAIQVASAEDSGLAKGTREALAGVTEPVHIQVLVTPT